MSINPVEKFEIEAEVFRLMTGEMAPGKSAPSAMYPVTIEVRIKMWSEWFAKHGEAVHATIRAIERRIAELEAENERLRTEIEALEDEVEQADEDAAQRARWESLSPAEREQAIKVNL